MNIIEKDRSCFTLEPATLGQLDYWEGAASHPYRRQGVQFSMQMVTFLVERQETMARTGMEGSPVPTRQDSHPGPYQKC